MAKVATVVKAGTKTTGKKEGTDFTSLIKEKIDTAQSAWFDIDVLLSKARKEPEANGKFHWENKGYTDEKTGYYDWCKEEFGMEPRVAQFRLGNGDMINDLELDREKIASLGWTKFRVLVPILKDRTESEVDRILKTAGKMTVGQITEFVNKQKIEAAGGTHKTQNKVVYTLLEEQAVVCQHAIDKAMKLLDTDNPNRAYEAICIAFLQNFEESQLDKVLKKMTPEEEKDEAVEKAKPRKEKAKSVKVVRKEAEKKKEAKTPVKKATKKK